MGEVQYMVSEAAKRTGVDERLLLYWEKHLCLPCGRTENGHRYYTDEDIRLFSCIKELLEQGIRIGDLKDVIPDILHTKEALQNKSKEETPESLLASVLRTVLAENNPILEKQISETITKQVSQNMSFLLQAKERQEEERYRNLDHLIRQQQLYRKESVRTAPSRFSTGCLAKPDPITKSAAASYHLTGCGSTFLLSYRNYLSSFRRKFANFV